MFRVLVGKGCKANHTYTHIHSFHMYAYVYKMKISILSATRIRRGAERKSSVEKQFKNLMTDLSFLLSVENPILRRSQEARVYES